MDKKFKTLKESKTPEQISEMVFKAKNSRFFRKALEKRLKEAVLDGSGYCDGDDDCAVGEVYNEVILGCEPYLTREIARVFITDKPEFTIPLNTTGEAEDLTCNQDTGDTYGIGVETTTCELVKLNLEPGKRALWTRSYLEDASWDVMARQTRGVGRAIEEYIMDLIIAQYLWHVQAAGGKSTGQVACYTLGAITWAEFTAAVGTMEEADGHPDVLLVAPNLYSQLLALQQFTDASWMGSAETMKSGVVLTTFGMKVIRSSRVPAGIGFLIDSDKAGALVIRRDITVEPIERPELNQYGFVGSARIGFGMQHGCALYMLSGC